MTPEVTRPTTVLKTAMVILAPVPRLEDGEELSVESGGGGVELLVLFDTHVSEPMQV